MTKLCLNCGHKKGSHATYGGFVKDGYDGLYTQCQECDCQDFMDIKDYSKHRKMLVENKFYVAITKLDKKYAQFLKQEQEDG